MQWHQIVLSASDNLKAKRLQEAFEEVFVASGGPRGAAMYTTQTLESAQTKFFFSPRADQIFKNGLQLHFSTKTNRPASDAVTLLVGHDAARDTKWVENPT